MHLGPDPLAAGPCQSRLRQGVSPYVRGPATNAQPVRPRTRGRAGLVLKAREIWPIGTRGPATGDSDRVSSPSMRLTDGGMSRASRRKGANAIPCARTGAQAARIAPLRLFILMKH